MQRATLDAQFCERIAKSNIFDESLTNLPELKWDLSASLCGFAEVAAAQPDSVGQAAAETQARKPCSNPHFFVFFKKCRNSLRSRLRHFHGTYMVWEFSLLQPSNDPNDKQSCFAAQQVYRASSQMGGGEAHFAASSSEASTAQTFFDWQI